MKFTSEDLMKAMDLQVGDTIKLKNIGGTFTIKQNGIFIHAYANEDGDYLLHHLVDHEYEIVPRPKRVGDLKCGEYGEHNCNSCPIRAICVSDEYNDETLYSKLELSHKFAKDQEIYDLLKARLDKEVEE